MYVRMPQMSFCCHDSCESPPTHECAGCGLLFCGWHTLLRRVRDARGFESFKCTDGCQNMLEMIACMDFRRMREKEACSITRSECKRCHGHFLLYETFKDGFLNYALDICSDCRVEGHRRLREKALRTPKRLSNCLQRLQIHLYR